MSLCLSSAVWESLQLPLFYGLAASIGNVTTQSELKVDMYVMLYFQVLIFNLVQVFKY